MKSKALSKPPAGAKPKRPFGAGRGREQGRPAAALSRERIAAAALALVDREGLPALSTRRLGDELGCEAMSIYHHFPNKAHLMDALVDLMLAEARVAEAGEGDWLERLRRTGFSDGDAARYFREIGYYLVGAALDETAGYAKGPSAAEPVSDETIAADFKHLAAAAPYFQPGHFQATFETGLEILLEGIRRAHGNRT
jgi:AcrR family transcriptional regulator